MNGTRALSVVLLLVLVAGCGLAPSAPPSPRPNRVTMEQLAGAQQAFDGKLVAVAGALIEIQGTPILCAALAEVAPDGCAGPRLVLTGPIPDGVMGLTVEAEGVFHAERGPAAMSLEVHAIRPFGAG